MSNDQELNIAANIEGLGDFQKLDKILDAAAGSVLKFATNSIQYNEQGEIVTFTTQSMVKGIGLLSKRFDIVNDQFKLVSQNLNKYNISASQATTAQNSLNAAIASQPKIVPIQFPQLKQINQPVAQQQAPTGPSQRQQANVRSDVQKTILSKLPQITPDVSSSEAQQFQTQVDKLTDLLSGKTIKGGRANVLNDLFQQASTGAIGTGKTIQDKLLNQINSVISATKLFGTESKRAQDLAQAAAQATAQRIADAATLENKLRSTFPISSTDKNVLSRSEVSRNELAVNNAKRAISDQGLELQRALQIIDQIQNKSQLTLEGSVENSFARRIRTLQLTEEALGRGVAKGTDTSNFAQRQADAVEVGNRLKKAFTIDPSQFSTKQIGDFNSVISALQRIVATGDVTKDRLFKILDSIKNKTNEAFQDKGDDSAYKRLNRLINLYDKLGESASKAATAQKSIEQRQADSQSFIKSILGQGNNQQLLAGASPQAIGKIQAAIAPLLNKIQSGKPQFALPQIQAVQQQLQLTPNTIFPNNAQNTIAQQLNTIQQAFTAAGSAGKSAGQNIVLAWSQVVRIFQVQVLHTIIAGLIGDLNSSIATAAKFQISVSEIQTISQSAAISTDEWSKTLRGLSDNFNLELLDTTRAAYDALSNQVVKGAQATQFLAESAAFAKTTVTSLANAGNLLASVQNAYNTSIVETNHNAAVLFDLIDKGRVRADEIANTFGNVASLSTAAGISLEETSAALSTLTVQGIRYNVAYTLLNNITSKLLRPTEEMKKLYDEWGVSTGQQAIAAFGLVGVLQKLNTVVQERGPGAISEIAQDIRPIRGILGLTGESLKTFEKNLKSAFDPKVEEDYAKATNIIVQSVGAKFQTLQNILKNITTVDFGNTILKGLVEATELIGKFEGQDGKLKFTLDTSGVGGGLQFVQKELTITGTTLATVISNGISGFNTLSKSLGGEILGGAVFKTLGLIIQTLLIPAITAYIARLVTIQIQSVLTAASTSAFATSLRGLYNNTFNFNQVLSTGVTSLKNYAASLATLPNIITGVVVAYTVFVSIQERALARIDELFSALEDSYDKLYERQGRESDKAATREIKTLENQIRESKQLLAQYAVEKTKALQGEFDKGFNLNLQNPAAAEGDLAKQLKSKVDTFEKESENLNKLQQEFHNASEALDNLTKKQADFKNEFTKNIAAVEKSFLSLTNVLNKARAKTDDPIFGNRSFKIQDQFGNKGVIDKSQIEKQAAAQIDIVQSAIDKANKNPTKLNVLELEQELKKYDELISAFAAGAHNKVIKIFDFDAKQKKNDLFGITTPTTPQRFGIVSSDLEGVTVNGKILTTTLEEARDRANLLRESIEKFSKAGIDVKGLREEYDKLDKSIKSLKVEDKEAAIKISIDADTKTFDQKVKDKKSLLDKVQKDVLAKLVKSSDEDFKKNLEQTDKLFDTVRERTNLKFVGGIPLIAGNVYTAISDLKKQIKDLNEEGGNSEGIKNLEQQLEKLRNTTSQDYGVAKIKQLLSLFNKTNDTDFAKNFHKDSSKADNNEINILSREVDKLFAEGKIEKAYEQLDKISKLKEKINSQDNKNNKFGSPTTNGVNQFAQEIEKVINALGGHNYDSIIKSFRDQLVVTFDTGRRKLQELREEADKFFSQGKVEEGTEKLKEMAHVIHDIKGADAFKQLENGVKDLDSQIKTTLGTIKGLIENNFRNTQLDFKLIGVDKEVDKTKIILDYVNKIKDQARDLYDIGNLDEARKKFDEINNLLKDLATRQLDVRAKAAKFGVKFTTPSIADSLVKGNFNEQLNLEGDALQKQQNAKNALNDLLKSKDQVPQLLKIDDSPVDPINAKVERLNNLLDKLEKPRRIDIETDSTTPKQPSGFSRGGLIKGYADGGFIGSPPAGDNTLIWARTGEYMMTEQATDRFAPILQAMNAGFAPRSNNNNNSTTNVGDIHIVMNGSESKLPTVRELGAQLRREIQRGTIRLN